MVSGIAGVLLVAIERQARSGRDSDNGEQIIIDTSLPNGVQDVKLRQALQAPLRIHRADGSVIETTVRSRLDTATEIDYFRCGGILQYVLNRRLEAA